MILLFRLLWRWSSLVCFISIPPLLFWAHVQEAMPVGYGTLLLFGFWCFIPFGTVCELAQKRDLARHRIFNIQLELRRLNHD